LDTTCRGNKLKRRKKEKKRAVLVSTSIREDYYQSRTMERAKKRKKKRNIICCSSVQVEGSCLWDLMTRVDFIFFEIHAATLVLFDRLI
jgi:hypothetical protein